MQKISSLVIFCAVLQVAAPAGLRADPIVIVNNSFETPVEGSGYVSDPSGDGWTFNGPAGIAGLNSPWFTATPPDGSQAAFLQAYVPGNGEGSFSQTISGLTVGDSYQISFYDAERYDAGNTVYYSPDEIEVSLGGSVVGDFTPGAYTFALNTTNSVVATSTSEVLMFAGISQLDGSDQDSLVDLVTMTDVTGTPEPGTFGLLIPALGYIVFSMRRRRGMSAS